LKNVNQTQKKLHGYEHILSIELFFKNEKLKKKLNIGNKGNRKKKNLSFGILKIRKNEK